MVPARTWPPPLAAGSAFMAFELPAALAFPSRPGPASADRLDDIPGSSGVAGSGKREIRMPLSK